MAAPPPSSPLTLDYAGPSTRRGGVFRFIAAYGLAVVLGGTIGALPFALKETSLDAILDHECGILLGVAWMAAGWGMLLAGLSAALLPLIGLPRPRGVRRVAMLFGAAQGLIPPVCFALNLTAVDRVGIVVYFVIPVLASVLVARRVTS